MIDLQKALSVATDAAHKASEHITKGFREEISFSVKDDPADRLTQTDLDAQKMIFETLNSAFPDHTLIGEENTDHVSSDDSPYTWIVDPLDGTMNFTHRLPFCGTSIALEIDGKPTLGVLCFPMLNTLYTAVRGEGAQKNGKPIRVRECKTMEDAMIAEIFSDRETRGTMAAYPPVMAYRKFGSAITSLAFLAEGSIDGTVLRCRPWDIAAGRVIIEEAGGMVTITMDDESDPRSALTCIASTTGIHEELCEFVELTIEKTHV